MSKHILSLASFHIRPMNPTHPQVQHTIKRQVSKRKCVECIVPFLSQILQIEASTLSRQTEECIINLDNLAQKIDLILDVKQQIWKGSTPTISNFPDLEKRILNCLDDLKYEVNYNLLVKDTFDCIELSLKFNTFDRGYVYSLDNTLSQICTTYYLLPLIRSLCSLSPLPPFDITRLFVLFSNYVQIIDDFIDAYDDTNNDLLTPVVLNWKSENTNNNLPDFFGPSFVILLTHVQNALELYFKAIIGEISKYSHEYSFITSFREWHDFHQAFCSVDISKFQTPDEQILYLQQVKIDIPPIVCYLP